MAVDGVGSATGAAAFAVQATDGDDAKSVAMLRKSLDHDMQAAQTLLASIDPSAGGRLDIRA